MEIQTLPTQLALPRLHKPNTNRHCPQIKVVGILAIIPDLAKVPEVMLAYRGLLLAFSGMEGEWRWGFEVGRGGGGVAVWTEGRGEGAAGWEEGEGAYLVVWGTVMLAKIMQLVKT